MREMQPTFLRLDRGRAEAVLAFLDRVIETRSMDLFLADDRVLNVITQPPADASPLPVAAKSAIGRV